MDEKQNKRKNRSDDDRQNPVFLMVHKTVENNHFYCGLLLRLFMENRCMPLDENTKCRSQQNF